MRTVLPKTLVFLLFCNACNGPVKTDDFSAARSKQFEQALFAQYSHYQVKNTFVKDGDFIAGYQAFCGGKSHGIKANYQLLQSWQLYRVVDDTVRSTMEYNLLHFKNPAAIDPLLADLKAHNCIDEQTLKMHRLYKIGTGTLMCVSFYKFDMVGFENLIRTEFNRNSKNRNSYCCGVEYVGGQCKLVPLVKSHTGHASDVVPKPHLFQGWGYKMHYVNRLFLEKYLL